MTSPAPKKTSARNLPRAVPGALIRVILLAMVAVLACGWALVHMLTRTKQPMVVPAEPAPSEIPAPETSP